MPLVLVLEFEWAMAYAPIATTTTAPAAMEAATFRENMRGISSGWLAGPCRHQHSVT